MNLDENTDLSVDLSRNNPVSLPTNVRPKVMFAGTFDHLHAGHKHVLYRALQLTSDTLYIGFASDSLLCRKRFAVALQPLELRMVFVSEYLQTIMSTMAKKVKIELFETPDAIGPAGIMQFDTLIVTPETLSGGEAVNAARSKAGLVPVEIYVVDLLGDEDITNKTSSTEIRAALCAQLPNGESDMCMLRDSFLSFGSVRWWSILRDMYGLETWRKYHTLHHVLELVQLVQDEYDGLPPNDVLMAIWFHDCVYNPKHDNNEKESAIVYEEFLRVSGKLPNKQVGEAILMTQNHLTTLAHLDETVPDWISKFLEMDLAILAAEPSRYQEYSEQIRREYPHVSEYHTKRTVFLNRFSNFHFKHLKNSQLLNSRLSYNIKWEQNKLK